MEDPVVPLERNLYGHPLAIMEKAIRENPIETRLGEGFQIGNVSLHTVKKDFSHLCTWMT